MQQHVSKSAVHLKDTVDKEVSQTSTENCKSLLGPTTGLNSTFELHISPISCSALIHNVGICKPDFPTSFWKSLLFEDAGFCNAPPSAKVKQTNHQPERFLQSINRYPYHVPMKEYALSMKSYRKYSF